MDELTYLQMVYKVNKLLNDDNIINALSLSDLNKISMLTSISEPYGCPMPINDIDSNVLYSTVPPSKTAAYKDKITASNSCDNANPDVYDIYKYTFNDKLKNIIKNNWIYLKHATKVDIIFDHKTYDDIPQNKRIQFKLYFLDI